MITIKTQKIRVNMITSKNTILFFYEYVNLKLKPCKQFKDYKQVQSMSLKISVVNSRYPKKVMFNLQKRKCTKLFANFMTVPDTYL